MNTNELIERLATKMAAQRYPTLFNPQDDYFFYELSQERKERITEMMPLARIAVDYLLIELKFLQWVMKNI